MGYSIPHFLWLGRLTVYADYVPVVLQYMDVTGWDSCISELNCRGVARGGEEGARGLSGFLWKKLDFFGRCVVLWASNMPQMHWQLWLHPGLHWRSSWCSPNSPSRLERETPSPIRTPLSAEAPRFPRLRHSASVAPSVKSWLHPCWTVWYIYTSSLEWLVNI